MAISKEACDEIIADILSGAVAPVGVHWIVEDTRAALADAGCSMELPESFDVYYQWILLGRI